VPLKYIYNKVPLEDFQDMIDEAYLGCKVDFDDDDILERELVLSCESITWPMMLENEENLSEDDFIAFARNNPNMTLDIYHQYQDKFGNCQIRDILINLNHRRTLYYKEVLKYNLLDHNLLTNEKLQYESCQEIIDHLDWFRQSNPLSERFPIDLNRSITISYESYQQLLDEDKKYMKILLDVEDIMEHKLGRFSLSLDPKPIKSLDDMIAHRDASIKDVQKLVVYRWKRYTLRPCGKTYQKMMAEVASLYEQ
jgi:hypothetical protein